MLHWTAIKKILRYLSGTQDWRISINKVPNFNISGFCDVDWESDSSNRKVEVDF